MNPRLALLVVAIGTASVTQSAVAQPGPHQIVITENSSTSLSVTYDGSTTGITVLNPNPDQWTVTLPTTVNLSPGTLEWLEPPPIGFGANFVTFAGGPGMTIISDVSDSIGPPAADDSTVTNVGIDSSNGGSISVTFDDDGDVATVPDAGSTFGLFFLALVALVSATRFRQLRLA